VLRTIFCGLAKLRFQFLDALFYRCPALVDQLLGLFSGREIKRRTELRRRNPDYPASNRSAI
jgi:hypothetical protein